MFVRLPRLPLTPRLRPLGAGTLVSAFGNGAWYASWALFFTRILGLGVAEAGIALTVSGLAGIVAATPLGHLADRVGAREILIALSLVRPLSMAGFLLVDGLAGLIVVSSVLSACQQGASGVRTALVVAVAGPEARVDALASLRVLGHAGDAVGAALGALVITLDAPAGYTALVIGNALTFLAYGAAVARLPRVAVVRETGDDRPGLAALRDLPYVSLAAICGVLTLSWAMVSTALPLWVAEHTDAPLTSSGILVVVSSLSIVAFQVPTARAADTPTHAARSALVSGLALAASCLLFAAASGPAAYSAALLLAAGGVAHVAGELFFVAASWGLSVPLMREDCPAQYQGVFATGEAAALTAAPLLMTTVVVGWGTAGWLTLAALFLAATAPAPALTRRALRARAARMAPPNGAPQPA